MSFACIVADRRNLSALRQWLRFIGQTPPLDAQRKSIDALLELDIDDIWADIDPHDWLEAMTASVVERADESTAQSLGALLEMRDDFVLKVIDELRDW